MSQDIPSLPTHPAAWDPNQPTPIPNTLVTPASHHPHVDTHPALPLRVAPGLLFLGGPHPLCSFTLYFKTPTETDDPGPWEAPPVLRSQVSEDWFVLCIILKGLGAAV